MNQYEILEKYFGYHEFRKGQDELIEAVLNGQDVLGIMPTGAGKSICYQVPALMMPGITLVISPLISLMKDQVGALNQAGIHAAYINSSLSETQIYKALQLAAKGQYKIIYVAPERLETYEFLQMVSRIQISMITVDEAHCISQWGQDFRPSYLKIVSFIGSLPDRPVISAFTATATQVVRKDILRILELEDPKILVSGFDRENLYFAVEKPVKKDAYVLTYANEHVTDSGIIYCATRKNVDKVWELLNRDGLAATRYHAGLSAEERKENQDDFIYERKNIMVATNAFGMGIDKSNVRYVIHYNMPQSLENYYQEAGRGGRDGERAECILLYSPQDVVINRMLIESKEGNQELSGEEVFHLNERDAERLNLMNYYCMTTKCLRNYILQYFGEAGNEECKNCSNCLREYHSEDVSEQAREILKCMAECGQRYGTNVIAGIVCGSSNAKLREYHVENYRSYGALKALSEAYVKQIISQMLVEDIIFQTNDKYILLRCGKRAKDLLEENIRLILKTEKRSEKEKEALSTGKSSKKKVAVEGLNAREQELFQLLRTLRMELARKEKVPPYLIFSDKTLVDMCVRLPLTKEEMLQVSGVGENKLMRYGDEFIQKVMEFTEGKEEMFLE